MSWHPFAPAGLEIVSGTELSSTGHYAHAEETIFCAGGGGFLDPPDATIPHAVLSAVAASDSYAADHVSALAAYELVQIFTTGGGAGGAQGGWHDCAEYHAGDPMTSGNFTSVSVTGGPSSELRSGDDGTLLPIMNPFQPNFTPIVGGLFMRPVALEWDGQDPAEDANRSVWLPSEVIGAIGGVGLSLGFVESSEYDVTFGTGVRALNVISGTPRLPGTTVEQPVICFV